MNFEHLLGGVNRGQSEWDLEGQVKGLWKFWMKSASGVADLAFFKSVNVCILREFLHMHKVFISCDRSPHSEQLYL